MNTKDIEINKSWWFETPLWLAQVEWLPWTACILYLVTIYVLRNWVMKSRHEFDLKPALVVWNMLLATFSIIGAYYVVPAMVITRANGSSPCLTEGEYQNPWTFLFCMSKFPELIDTVFICLRKRPLIFLHYYHHVATLLFCWYAWAESMPGGGWFAAMNLCVHSVMYSYYALCSGGFRFSQPVRLTITSLQILQMVGGIVIIIRTLLNCPQAGTITLYLGLVMYLSYFLLFVKLFIAALKPVSKSHHLSKSHHSSSIKVQ